MAASLSPHVVFLIAFLKDPNLSLLLSTHKIFDVVLFFWSNFEYFLDIILCPHSCPMRGPISQFETNE